MTILVNEAALVGISKRYFGDDVDVEGIVFGFQTVLTSPHLLFSADSTSAELSEIRLRLLDLRRSIKCLSQSSRSVLFETPKPYKNSLDPIRTRDSGDAFAEKIDKQIRGVETLLDWNKRYLRKPSNNKRNWRAIAATHECRKLWEKHKEIRAPKTANRNKPTEFVGFLEETLEALEITGRNGEPVRADTALNAWRETVEPRKRRPRRLDTNE